MSTPKLPAMALALGLGSGAALAAGPNLGIPLEPADIAAWDISIQPDGTGLPIGGGTPAQGARIFAQKCALCHGENGKGGVFAARKECADFRRLTEFSRHLGWRKFFTAGETPAATQSARLAAQEEGNRRRRKRE